MPETRTKRDVQQAAEKPRALLVDFKNIPPELRALVQWVVWRYTWKPGATGKAGKWDKPPSNAHTGENASSTNPATWSSFDKAMTAYREGSWDGVGFMFTADDPFIGVDLDDCRNPETGMLHEWGAKLVDELATYTETSPSGTGVKAFAKASKPGDRCKAAYAGGHVEIYDHGRYFTVTGHCLDGSHPTVNERQSVIDRIYDHIFSPRATPTFGPLDDEAVLREAAAHPKNGADFQKLWNGDASDHGEDASRADLALCNHLRFWCGGDRAQVDRLFRRSGLMRPKWDEQHGAKTYGEMTLDKAMPGKTRGDGSHIANGNGTAGSGRAAGTSSTPPPTKWPDPLPLGAAPPVPSFPVDALPGWLADWTRCRAEATQTPPDLAGMLALGVLAAGAAGKLRIRIRPDWSEPLNLFIAVALLPGERKSAEFAEAMAPVQDHEATLQQEAAPAIAEAVSVRRQLEGRLKSIEGKIAKAGKGVDVPALREQAKDLARELAAHTVPMLPRLWCDDIPPEKLANQLAEQGGRMLQASAEGTLFEIVQGRYSEGGRVNMEVYLKGHAGDALRVQRIGRPDDIVERPALSTVVAVQPDVIRGAAEHAVLRNRGFLARWLYSMPVSLVGSRRIATRPVPDAVREAYRSHVLRVWQMTAEHGDVLELSAEADATLQELERWLEPQLAEGEALSMLAGWAGKLAGACARLAGVIHLAKNLGPEDPVSEESVRAAIRLGRDYLLPHAQAAFALMGADERIPLARRVWRAARKLVTELLQSVKNGGKE